MDDLAAGRGTAAPGEAMRPSFPRLTAGRAARTRAGFGAGHALAAAAQATLQRFHLLLQRRDRLLQPGDHAQQFVPARGCQIQWGTHHASNIARQCYIGYPSLNSYGRTSHLTNCVISYKSCLADLSLPGDTFGSQLSKLPRSSPES